jgi:hypothetical protein
VLLERPIDPSCVFTDTEIARLLERIEKQTGDGD